MKNIFFQNDCFTWHNLHNPDEHTISQYLEDFKLDSFTVQDAMEPGHLPKFEHQENFDFVLIRFFGTENQPYTNIIREFSHKVGIFLGTNFIITVHQKEVPFWDKLRNELNADTNQEKLTSKQLFYKIFRKVLTTYLNPAVNISEEIDQYENTLFTQSDRKINLNKLYLLKRESSTCSKILILIREVMDEYRAQHIKNSSTFKDLQEYNAKLVQLHTQNTDDLHNLFNLALSVSDQRANEVMKILTIFSAFFLPLSFIAGLYGMNFHYMPELTYKWGYYITLIGMVLVVAIIYFWFKRKKFL